MNALLKGYAFRLYPSHEQQTQLAKTFGCVRFVYNHFLNQWQALYDETQRGLSYNACSKELTKLKKELPWLKDVDSTALQSTLNSIASAFPRLGACARRGSSEQTHSPRLVDRTAGDSMTSKTRD